jgi:hypothetical protein
MTTSKQPVHSHLLRLQLSPVSGVGPLDGAWWPRSRDLDVELADLVDHFPAEAGHISRAIFSRPDWLTSPRQIQVARGHLKTGSFPRDDTHVLLLKLSSGVQLKILVVPPDTGADSARDLMASAVASTNRRTGAALLARAREGGRGDPTGHWNDDGGAPMRPHSTLVAPRRGDAS